jgi:hypothetical protein
MFLFYSLILSCFLFNHHLSSSQLDYLIPAEIHNDSFYKMIVKLASHEPIKTILEIGSSSGEGSTQAFYKGISSNPSKPHLYCLELSVPRFQALVNRYADSHQVHAYNLSSISIDEFPDWKTVEAFLATHPMAYHPITKREIRRWHQQDLDYLIAHQASINGISHIKAQQQIEFFDVVLIDGSEFTGIAELPLVYGARFILLDDIKSFKNFDNYHILLNDPLYECIDVNFRLRNGYAVFKRRSY